jgi:hypothetical protein
MFEIADPERGVLRGETQMCVHCNAHFPIQPGSGKIRGFCFSCMGAICGPRCAECVHFLQKLDNLEAGRPENYKPASILVPQELNLTGALE